MAAQPVAFSPPMRYIYDAADHQAFVHSPAHDDLLKFIAAINAAIVDKPCSAECTASPVVGKVIDALNTMRSWVDDIPPLTQAMRYGNKAFRTWHTRLVQDLIPMCKGFTEGFPAAQGAHVELAAYLVDSFGNCTRIDYGTGHETCFILFLYAACKAGLMTKEDLPAIGLRVFPAYINVCRKLQRTYWLEPAGSHGVWSLDDYQFLVFLFGSAQLLNHKHIKPRSIHSKEVLESYGPDFMYLGAVNFIMDVKSGAPFAEHSPILNDIGELPHWGKVNEGLAKMYRAEVLGKLPVVQHLVFGGLFQANWAPSRPPVPSDSCAHLYAHMQAVESGAGPAAAAAAAAGDSLSSPPGQDEVPTDHASMATAPWATEPLCLHKHHPHEGAHAAGGSGSGAAGGQPPLTITGVAPWATAAGAGGAAGGGAAGHGHGHGHGMAGVQTVAPWARGTVPDAGMGMANSPGGSPAGSSFHEAFPGLKHQRAHRSPVHGAGAGAGQGGATPQGMGAPSPASGSGAPSSPQPRGQATDGATGST